jgi:hypothetical protein
VVKRAIFLHEDDNALHVLDAAGGSARRSGEGNSSGTHQRGEKGQINAHCSRGCNYFDDVFKDTLEKNCFTGLDHPALLPPPPASRGASCCCALHDERENLLMISHHKTYE